MSCKGEKGAICILDDEIARTTKYVKPMNLIIGKDEAGNPVKLKDLVNTVDKLVADNRKLYKAMDGVLTQIEKINSSVELLKAEVM